jgi:hypothetical protein
MASKQEQHLHESSQIHNPFCCYLLSISSTFYEDLLRQYSCAKNYKATVIREKLRKPLQYKEDARKLLMKMTPGFDFINVLRTAFALVDPKSVRT